ncbi:MAG: LCP family protein [Spirochaetes bacterium]|nr:LCP family protein [Spirochaetota bacterium]
MKKIIIALFIALSLALFITNAVVKMNLNRRNIISQLQSESSMINVLVAGANNFNDNRFSFFMLVSINPDKSSVGLTFIPPTYSVDAKDDGSGVKLNSVDLNDFSIVSKAIERDLGLKVPFYISLYSVDAQRITDLVEGINLFIFESAKLLKGLSSGVNYLDGKKSLEYINNVENNSIYYKYDRVMDIVLSLSKNRELYRKFINRPFIERASETLRTNLTIPELESLLQLLVDNTSVHWTLLPGQLEPDGVYSMDEIARKMYRDTFLRKLVVDSETEKNIKVTILNGTTVSGLAMKTRKTLMRDGINVVQFGTYHDQNLQKTLIIDQKGDSERLDLISSKLEIENRHHVIDSTQLHDILVIIGNDLGVLNDEK